MNDILRVFNGHERGAAGSVDGSEFAWSGFNDDPRARQEDAFRARIFADLHDRARSLVNKMSCNVSTEGFSGVMANAIFDDAEKKVDEWLSRSGGGQDDCCRW